MVFKTLGFVTSFGNIAVLLASVYNNTFNNLNSAHWNIALGSILFLSISSITFFYLSNKKHGINALKLYGAIYAFLSILIYTYWCFKNLFFDLSFTEFKGLFLLFLTLFLISSLSLGSYVKNRNGKLLLLFANVLSVITVAITFGAIYKYVFLQSPFNFDNLMLELFTIFLGSFLFLGTYFYAKNQD